MTLFRTWMLQHYAAATAYRNALHTVYVTGRDFCQECVVEDKHIAVLIECLRAIPMPPPHGKYSGEVTDADKEWYREEGRIDNGGRLMEYIEMVKKIKQWK